MINSFIHEISQFTICIEKSAKNFQKDCISRISSDDSEIEDHENSFESIFNFGKEDNSLKALIKIEDKKIKKSLSKSKLGNQSEIFKNHSKLVFNESFLDEKLASESNTINSPTNTSTNMGSPSKENLTNSTKSTKGKNLSEIASYDEILEKSTKNVKSEYNNPVNKKKSKNNCEKRKNAGK